jgi:hypothetical protein
MAQTRQAALIWSQEDQQYLWRGEKDTSACSKKRDHMEEMGTGMPIDVRENAPPKSTPGGRLI